MNEAPFEVSEHRVNDVTTFALRMGPSQRSSIAGFHQLICTRIAAGDSKFVVNLSECSWIDSKNLGELVRALVAVMRQGGGLKLAELPQRVRAILQITNLTQVFEVFDTEQEAIQSYAAAQN